MDIGYEIDLEFFYFIITKYLKTDDAIAGGHTFFHFLFFTFTDTQVMNMPDMYRSEHARR